MPTRPCKYCLSFQDDSVFADFEKDELGHLYLVRISYDGYGCCNLEQEDEHVKISSASSAALIEFIENEDLSNPALVNGVMDYLHEIKDRIWPDALKYHGLIK